MHYPANIKHCIPFIQSWNNIEDVGPTLYKCYTNVLFAGLVREYFSQDKTPSQQTQNICIRFIQCRENVEDVWPTLHKCYTNVLCLNRIGIFQPGQDTIPANTKPLYNIHTMLGQRRRRWPSIV